MWLFRVLLKSLIDLVIGLVFVYGCIMSLVGVCGMIMGSIHIFVMGVSCGTLVIFMVIFIDVCFPRFKKWYRSESIFKKLTGKII